MARNDKKKRKKTARIVSSSRAAVSYRIWFCGSVVEKETPAADREPRFGLFPFFSFSVFTTTSSGGRIEKGGRPSRNRFDCGSSPRRLAIRAIRRDLGARAVPDPHFRFLFFLSFSDQTNRGIDFEDSKGQTGGGGGGGGSEGVETIVNLSVQPNPLFRRGGGIGPLFGLTALTPSLFRNKIGAARDPEMATAVIQSVSSAFTVINAPKRLAFLFVFLFVWRCRSALDRR